MPADIPVRLILLLGDAVMNNDTKEYPKWCCQRCGEETGYLGKFKEFIHRPLLGLCKEIYHDCPGLFVSSAKEVPEGQCDKRADHFPVIKRLDGASHE